jgi:hypothetical protein
MRQSVNVFLAQTTTRFHRTSLEVLLARKNKGLHSSRASVPPFQHHFGGHVKRRIAFKPQINIYKRSAIHWHMLIGHGVCTASFWEVQRNSILHNIGAEADGKKLSLCLTTQWRRMGEWMYRSAFSLPRHQLKVSCQLHVTPDLLPGKEPPVPIG